jgi:hypothetical protein
MYITITPELSRENTTGYPAQMKQNKNDINKLKQNIHLDIF